jgi:hypothetical protein
LTHEVATVDAVDPSVWVTVAELGRLQRPPISRQAANKRVNRFVELGVLSTKPGPQGTRLVNVVAFARLVAQETDPAQALRNGRPPAEPPEADEVENDDAGGQAGDGPSYHKSRAHREAYQAENARLDLLERLDRTADADDVDRRTMTTFRKVRDRMLALPAQVSADLAAAPDERTLRAVLRTEINRVLEALADELDHLYEEDDADDADDGAAAREPAQAREREEDQA